MNVVIKGARVVDSKVNMDSEADILISEGIIQEVGQNLQVPKDYDVIDARGLTAFPGLCDIHVHFRDPGWPQKETLESGGQVALAGGVTTVVNMANTNPVVDNVETLNYIMEKADKLPITVLQNSAMTKGLGGKDLTDGQAMLNGGACGFSDDGIPIVDVGVMIKGMEQAKKYDKVFSLHEELPALFFSQGVNYGPAAEAVGVAGAPGISESALIERDILLQKKYGSHLHFQHISAARSVELIREAKAKGQKITCEVTPQHLTLTEQVVVEKGTLGRINPPIRSEEDRQALIGGILDGTIDCIVTDHAPHTSEEKSKPFAQAPSGMIGLETSLSIAFDTLVRSGLIDRIRLSELMSVNPAALYGIEKGIRPGLPADICLFDENQEYVYKTSASKSTNSPFLGQKLKGKVKYTLAKGQIYKIMNNED